MKRHGSDSNTSNSDEKMKRLFSPSDQYGVEKKTPQTERHTGKRLYKDMYGHSGGSQGGHYYPM